MTHWSRVTHREAPSAGSWLAGWGLGRLGRFRGAGRLCDQPSYCTGTMMIECEDSRSRPSPSVNLYLLSRRIHYHGCCSLNKASPATPYPLSPF